MNAQIRPMKKAPTGLTTSQPAVMPIRPASAPLMVRPTSGLPYFFQARNIAVSAPTAAARFVVMKMLPISTQVSLPSAVIVEPGLKPNQPIHSRKMPSIARVMLWPGMARALPFLSNLPIRGPRKIAPINAEMPPTMCTTVEPAKSWKPSCASQPSEFQHQWPEIG